MKTRKDFEDYHDFAEEIGKLVNNFEQGVEATQGVAGNLWVRTRSMYDPAPKWVMRFVCRHCGQNAHMEAFDAPLAQVPCPTCQHYNTYNI